MIYREPQNPHSHVDLLRDPRVQGLVTALGDSSAPTSVHEADQVGRVHIADSLAGLEVDAVREARRIADLGAGAGLPGLVLAIARPDAEVVLVESVGKKCAWLERTVEELGLENVRVACARAEELDEAPFDVVTARALAALPVLCEYAAPLLREGGALVAWKGAVDAQEEADGQHAAEVAGARAGRSSGGRALQGLGAPHIARFSQDLTHATGLSAPTGNGRKTPVDRARHPHRPLVSKAQWAPSTRSRTRRAGSGKTTTAVNVAACIAEAGYETLLVDVDPQGNATVGLGLARDEGAGPLRRAGGRRNAPPRP